MLVNRQQLTGLADLGDGDPLVWTPGAIKDLIAQTDSDMSTLRVDGARGNLSVQQQEALLALAADWQAFKDNVGWTGLLWYGTVARTREYQQKILGWRDILGKSGSTVTGPGPQVPPNAVSDWLKWAAVIAVAVSGAVVVGKLTGVVGPLRWTNPRRRRR